MPGHHLGGGCGPGSARRPLGLPVLRALGIDRGVEVLLGRGFPDSRGPPGPRAPVDGRDLHALVGEPLQVETGHTMVTRADARIRVSRNGHSGLVAVTGQGLGAPDAVVTHRHRNWSANCA